MAANFRHIIKYTGIFGSVQGLNILIGIVRIKLVTWILGPNGVGLSSLFNSSTTFLSNATNLGISFSAVKNLSDYYEKGDEAQLQRGIAVVRTWSVIAAMLGFVATMIAAPFLDLTSFRWGNHTMHFLLLAPTVFLLAITGGETAILKSTRKLKELAKTQSITILLSLIISVPIYYLWGEKGIVPVIFLTALTTAVATVFFSVRYFPYRVSFIREYIHEGSGMVRLGLAFIFAGILGSGAEFCIRAYLNSAADLATVGLYYAAYTIAITYTSVVLSSLENDYFPRLSAVAGNTKEMSEAINSQIEVTVLIISPMLIGLMFTLPIIIPLLFSSKFASAIPMTQVALFSMLFRAVAMPMEYVPLAKGQSKTYLLIEAVFDISTVICIIGGYMLWGLYGAGVGLTLTYSINLIFVLAYAARKFRFHLTRRIVCCIVSQALLMAASYAVVVADMPLAARIALMALLFCLSAGESFWVLFKEIKK